MKSRESQVNFEEYGEQQLILIYVYDDKYNKSTVRDNAKELMEFMDDEVIVSDGCKLVCGEKKYVMFGLSRTNIGIDEISRLRQAGYDTEGYKDMILSTVPVDSIVRLD